MVEFIKTALRKKMYEVELKAHVDDRKKIISKLNFFAEYIGAVQKDDIYWGLHDNERKIQARLRKETPLEFLDAEAVMMNIRADDARLKPDLRHQKIYFTYKRKEVRKNADGTTFEVNDEQETLVKESEPIEAFFKDLGLKILVEKHKTVISYLYEGAHIELCTVPPLGDFIEIEIMTSTKDEDSLESYRKKLIEILEKCGISEDKIEERYYSEMLQGIKNV